MVLETILQSGLPMSNSGLDLTGGMMAMAGITLLFFLIISLALYIYTSLAFMTIGKKVNDSLAGLAWIPGLGPAIIAFRASKMHWWPWLLIIGTIIPFINILFSFAFMIVSVIWMWKMFEAINKPGWFSILMLIPIVNLVVIGVAAWSK